MPEQLDNWWQAKSTYVAAGNVVGGVLLILCHIALMIGGYDEIVDKLDKSLLGLGTGVGLISAGGWLFVNRGTQERIIKQGDKMIEQADEAKVHSEKVAEKVAEKAAEKVLTESGLVNEPRGRA